MTTESRWRSGWRFNFQGFPRLNEGLSWASDNNLVNLPEKWSTIVPIWHVPANRSLDSSFSIPLSEFDSSVTAIFTENLTEDMWERHPWNPFANIIVTSYDGVNYLLEVTAFPKDPSASPKPSWLQLLAWSQEAEMEFRQNSWQSTDAVEGYARQSKNALVTKPVPHVLADAGIHVGEGLDHMPAIIYQGQRAARAGEGFGRAVMKDSKGEHVEVWLESEMHDLVSDQADVVANLESARNVIERKLADIAKPWFSSDGGLGPDATVDEIREARWKSYVAATDFVIYETIDGEMMKTAAEMGVASKGLPKELERARDKLIERLESASMAAVKRFKGVLTQQGVDLPSSCDDEDDAVRRVSRHCRLGTLAIQAAETIADAQAAYDSALVDINAVTPLNTPTWMVAGKKYPANHPKVVTRRSMSVVISATNPDEVPGAPIIGVSTEGGGILAQTRIDPDPPRPKSTLVQYSVTGSDDVTLSLIARNLCGPSSIKVRLKKD